MTFDKKIADICIRLGELDFEIEKAEEELKRLKDLRTGLEAQLRIEGQAS